MAVSLGVTLRGIHFYSNRSLWIDEARLAINVLCRSYLSLARPLAYDQTAPLLFLWAEKLVTGVLGPGEQALRLLPFAAGLASLTLTYALAKRFINEAGAVLAAALVAVGPSLIYFSNEAKPYSLDALVTIALLFLTLEWMPARDRSPAWKALLAAGAVSVWLSSPAPFVLAGVIVVILSSRDRTASERLRYAATAAIVWGASFILAYVLVLRSAAKNSYLQRFWSYSLLDPSRPEFGGRLWQSARDTFSGLFLGVSTEPFRAGALSHAIDAATAFFLVLAIAGTDYVRRSRGSAYRHTPGRPDPRGLGRLAPGSLSGGAPGNALCGATPAHSR